MTERKMSVKTGNLLRRMRFTNEQMKQRSRKDHYIKKINEQDFNFFKSFSIVLTFRSASPAVWLPEVGLQCDFMVLPCSVTS